VTLGKLFLDKENAGDDYYIDGFIDYLFELSDKIGLPGLKSAWADASDFPEIIEQTDCKNNPVKLSRENLNEILDKRYF
jgi:alcohol dehydrogenase class IV